MAFEVIGQIIFSAMILMIWSVLYKDNPFYKAVSSISVGLMLAFWLKGGLDSLAKDVFSPALLQGNIPRLIIVVLGLMIFLRFFKNLAFASKWPIAILAGVGTAIAVKGAIPAMVLSQVQVGTFVGSDIVANLLNIIVWFGVISTLVYFLFSFKRGQITSKISRVGQVYMMLSFGVVFGQSIYGASVMAQMLYLLTYPGYYVTAVAVVALVAYIAYSKTKG